MVHQFAEALCCSGQSCGHFELPRFQEAHPDSHMHTHTYTHTRARESIVENEKHLLLQPKVGGCCLNSGATGDKKSNMSGTGVATASVVSLKHSLPPQLQGLPPPFSLPAHPSSNQHSPVEGVVVEAAVVVSVVCGRSVVLSIAVVIVSLIMDAVVVVIFFMGALSLT